MTETARTDLQKRSNDTLSKTPLSRKKANKGGPKFDEVWQYFTQGEELNPGHYKATCYHCKKEWSRGRPVALKAHLANECLACPEDISKYWRDKLAENTAWVMAGIPFEVVENPFVLDLFKNLNPAYIPPSRTTLSGRLLNEEISRVNKKVTSELEIADSLTLTLDGWTSKRNESLYNYVITTSDRKEYLVALRNYSMESHTGEFLASEISDIVEKIGLDKFTAVVTDNASNCRVARRIIEEKYGHIWDIRYAAHAINLIAADLVKLNDIKKFISNCLKDMKINIERLQIWCKTRWGSLYMTADSILCARPVFDWILLEHNGIVTNSNVYLLIQDEEFFTNCHHIRSIWAPIKECINILEAKSASLADCFVQMIKLAIAIFRLPSSNPFKASAIQIFNHRYLEFQHPAYLLCYFLHPYYRGLGLNDEGFRNAAITATTLWQNLGYSEQECRELLTQFRKYDQKLKPYDLSYDKNMDTPELWWSSIRSKPYYLRDLALRLFCIAVSQAGCERNFSVLKWIIGDRRTRLDVQKLEGISKIRSYYLASIKNELSYYGKHLDETELREVANTSAVGEIIALDDNDNDTNYLLLEENQEREGTQERTTLILEDIIDFTQPIFENAENVDNNTNEEINIDRNQYR
ncbi:ribonuclease H-like domain-containing protein [Rhizophagus irregularis DAOM 181602=DAOM 197198]|nr:ribonuclease H-like domain-containing protein [Rhizophagus irregularis DAOM 181602=DAOM 197198]